MCKLPFTWNLSPLRPSKFSFEYLLLPPRSAPTPLPPGLTPRVLRRPPRPPTHRGLALAPTAGYRVTRLAKRHPFSGLVDSAVGHRNPASGSSRIASSAYQKWPTWSSRFRGTAQRSSSQRRPTYLKFENRSRGVAPPMPLIIGFTTIELAKGSSYPEGKLRREPATRRHSSPSFGSRQACSHSNPSQKIKVGRRCTREDPPISFLAPYGFSNPLTRTHVRLLGPCFKTGRMGSPQADARSTLVPKHAETARAGFHDRGDDVSTGVSKARAWAATTIRVGPRPEPIGGPALAVSTSDRGASPAPIPLPSRQFQALFDSSFQSPFHLSLAVLVRYRSLVPVFSLGRNLPRRLGLHSQTTRLVDSASWCDRVRARRGSHPLRRPFPGDLGPGPSLRTLLQTTIRTPRVTDSQAGLFPVRSPLLRESL
ncbi:hypothetical protein V6N13_097304 [Hibiscus sabdariffa]